MQYSVALSAILGCIAVVKAQTSGFNPFITPGKDQEIRAGEKFDITWTPAGAPPDATVSIKLLQGETPATLQLGPNVASKIPSKMGKFTWAVPRSIKDSETYGLVMYLDGKEDVFQYSFPFDIENLDNDKDDIPLKPGSKKTPSPHADDKDDKDDDKYDDKDDDKYDDKDDDKHDDKDDDDDDHPIIKGPAPPVAKLKDPGPDSMYNNGTKNDSPKMIYAPKPSSVKPPASKPSAPVGDKDKGKPKPINVSGASSLVLDLSTLIIGIVTALTFI